MVTRLVRKKKLTINRLQNTMLCIRKKNIEIIFENQIRTIEVDVVFAVPGNKTVSKSPLSLFHFQVIALLF